jgi:hypothetical protein
VGTKVEICAGISTTELWLLRLVVLNQIILLISVESFEQLFALSINVINICLDLGID